MRAPSSRTSKIVGFTAGPLAVLAAGAMVWQGSTAAFTANTSTANNWATGQITLTDNDVQGATFAVTGLAPGDKGSKCITVTATSTLKNAEGKLYVSVKGLVNETAQGAVKLADHLTLTMERGDFSSAECESPLANGTNVTSVFTSTHLSALADSNAVPAPAGTIPTPVPPAVEVTKEVMYKITYSFAPGTMTQDEQNSLMSQSAKADVVWELKAGTGA